MKILVFRAVLFSTVCASPSRTCRTWTSRRPGPCCPGRAEPNQGEACMAHAPRPAHGQRPQRSAAASLPPAAERRQNRKNVSLSRTGSACPDRETYHPPRLNPPMRILAFSDLSWGPRERGVSGRGVTATECNAAGKAGDPSG